MSKIKKGDNVIVIAGRDKGKRGDVSSIVDAQHVVVNGVNTVKKHTKPNPMKNQGVRSECSSWLARFRK